MPFSKKNIKFASEVGRRGAARRWRGHQKRVVKLSELTPDQRILILAVLRAGKGTVAP